MMIRRVKKVGDDANATRPMVVEMKKMSTDSRPEGRAKKLGRKLLEAMSSPRMMFGGFMKGLPPLISSSSSSSTAFSLDWESMFARSSSCPTSGLRLNPSSHTQSEQIIKMKWKVANRRFQDANPDELSTSHHDVWRCESAEDSPSRAVAPGAHRVPREGEVALRAIVPYRVPRGGGEESSGVREPSAVRHDLSQDSPSRAVAPGGPRTGDAIVPYRSQRRKGGEESSTFVPCPRNTFSIPVYSLGASAAARDGRVHTANQAPARH
ncbi:hypothetical protein T484DRAFT_1968058 [Baffinella frigidus]|nr:hypothetical protein T484DRAFT_1968058 [Cryptophyta sp. CCMP2293]